jgi:hypothetical protein
MIQLKILNSCDIDKIGTMVFYKNLIYVGNDHQCDLYLKDPELIPNHLIIEIVENKIIAHPHKNIEYFLVNGKRTTGAKIIVPGQSVSIGSNTFSIESFLETPINHYKENLNAITEKLIAENSPLLEIIGDIQESEL